MRATNYLSAFLSGVLVLSVAAVSLAQPLPAATEVGTQNAGNLAASLHEESSEQDVPEVTGADEKLAASETMVAVRPKKRVVAEPVKVAMASPLLAIVQQPDIKEEDQILSDNILRLVFPAQCEDGVLKKFYVYYGSDLKSRGYAGANTLIIQARKNKDEQRGLLIHEASHVLDLGCLTGTAASGESSFKDGRTVMYQDDPSVAFYSISWMTENIQKKGTKKADFVSGYAASNVFEDLSESVTYYVLAKEAFVTRAKTNKALAAKLAWIETYVFPGGVKVADGTKWNGTIPWDATKLSYTWTGGGEAVAVR
jgi:hypothetical protein